MSHIKNYEKDLDFNSLKNSPFKHPFLKNNEKVDSRVMAVYWPSKKYSIRHKDLFSQDICKNKTGPNDSTKRLAESMFDLMKEKFPNFLNSNFIVPIPNHHSNIYRDSGAIGIVKELNLIFKKNNYNIPVANILEKNFSQKMHEMGSGESRKTFFNDNELFSINMLNFEISNNIIKDSTVLLIDDVITMGLTTKACIDLLLGIGFKKIFLYVAGKTYQK